MHNSYRLPPRITPKAAKSRWLPKLLIQCLLTATFVALGVVGYQIVQEPPNLPTPASENATEAKDTLAALKSATLSKYTTSWTMSQDKANVFLKTTLKPQETDSFSTMTFERAFLRFDAGQATLGMEQKFCSKSLFFLMTFEVEPSENGVAPRLLGCSIGNLTVPNALMPVVSKRFAPIFTALSVPLDHLNKAKTITVTANGVAVEWVPAKLAAR